MHSTNLRLFALRVLLSTTIMVPLLLTGIASARCGASVTQYGQCIFRGDMLFCGACALNDSGSAISACDRCGAGYRCTSHGCAVLSRCADEYTCDMCGCSWGPPAALSHHGTRFVP